MDVVSMNDGCICFLLLLEDFLQRKTKSISILHLLWFKCFYLNTRNQRQITMNNKTDHTKSTALIHPSFSGWLVTWAYLPQTTFPPCVTIPSSLTLTWIYSHVYWSIISFWLVELTSSTVPLVITPKDVYRGELGFFFTPMIGNWKVAFNSGCVTCALVNRSA